MSNKNHKKVKKECDNKIQTSEIINLITAITNLIVLIINIIIANMNN